MFKKVLIVVAVLVCLQVHPALAERKRLILTGSSTVAPLASEIAKRFESLNPDVRIDVQTGGSSRGIADARRGIADFGMVSRTLKASESDLIGFPIAKDGICLILNKGNSVTKIADEQLVKIFRGEIKNWKEVGGSDAPITVVNKAQGRSTLELFLKYYKLDAKDIRADVVIGDNEQGIKTVAGNRNAIGYVSVGAAEYAATTEVPLKLLAVGGVTASTENVSNGSFPLSRELTLVTKTAPEGIAKAFLDFASSEKVKDIVSEQYLVPFKN